MLVRIDPTTGRNLSDGKSWADLIHQEQAGMMRNTGWDPYTDISSYSHGCAVRTSVLAKLQTPAYPNPCLSPCLPASFDTEITASAMRGQTNC